MKTLSLSTQQKQKSIWSRWAKKFLVRCPCPSCPLWNSLDIGQWGQKHLIHNTGIVAETGPRPRKSTTEYSSHVCWDQDQFGNTKVVDGIADQRGHLDPFVKQGASRGNSDAANVLLVIPTINQGLSWEKTSCQREFFRSNVCTRTSSSHLSPLHP